MPKKTLEIACARGAHVLVQVKQNQAALLLACRMLPRYQAVQEQDSCHSKCHGRVEQRIVRTYTGPFPNWFGAEWSRIQMAVQVQRIVHHRRRGVLESSTETAWWISTARLSASQCQHAIRGHWSIENQLHYVRDVALEEDACRVRHRPGILARIRSIALNCLRASKASSVTRAIYANSLNFSRAVAMAQVFN